LNAIRHLSARVRAFFRRGDLDRDFDQELKSHVAMLTQDNLERGMTREEARRMAFIRVGAGASLRDQHRDARGLPALETVLHDVRLALRSLARNPGFACLAVFTLALGIGASTATFSLIDRVLIRPLPFANADRLALVWEEAAALGYPRMDVSPANYGDWSRQSDVFEDLAAYFGNAFNLTGQGRPERLDGVHATPNLFSVLGATPFLGRSFLPSEGTPGNTGVVILSYALWQRRFGEDAGVIGRTVSLNRQPHVVVGIMPSGFQFPSEETQLWTPVAFPPATATRDNHFLRVVGRLRADRSWTQAQAEFDAIAVRLAVAYPKTNGKYGAIVVPLHEEFVGDAGPSLWLLEASALLLLFVACGNVAGLLITRGIGRAQEIAVRSALGAGRAQIARQLLIEGLTLSAIGGLAGVLVAVASFQFLDSLIPSTLRGAVAPGLDWRVLTFAFTVSLLSGALFGLAPMRAVSSLQLTRSLGARGSTQPRDRSRAVLVSAEIAMALVVVASTGLLVRTILNLERVDPGFQSDNVLTARLEVSFSGSSTLDRRKRFYSEVIARVRTLPGVVSAGFTTFLPYTNFGGSSALFLENRPELPDEARFAYRREVSPDYLATIGVPLLSGRWFEERDDEDRPPVAIVNEYIAGLLGGTATGKRMKLGPADSPWVTIVGVVGNIREEGLDTPTQRGTVYTPVAQSREAWYFNPRDLAIRVAGNPSNFVAALEREVWATNKDQTISNVRVMQALVDDQIAARKTQATLLTTFAGLAVFLAGLGVYGLMSFVVKARTREFGLRLALGADKRHLAAFVARQGLVWLAAGTVIGLAMTLAVSRTLEGLLFGVEPIDPLTLTAAVLLLISVGCVASLVPVYRATRTDPLAAVRFE
jgi:putative ABC transport system permease protein